MLLTKGSFIFHLVKWYQMKGFLHVILLMCICVPFNVRGQIVLDNNPTWLKWQQVNTQNFRVIFPMGFDVQAQRVDLHRVETSVLECRLIDATQQIRQAIPQYLERGVGGV